MKIRCHNSNCGIKFELEPNQKKCFYCGTSLKNLASSLYKRKFIKKNKKKWHSLITFVLPFILLIPVVPFLETATGDESLEQLADLGKRNLLKIVFIYGFMVFLIFLASRKKKILKGGVILSGIFWVLGSGLVFSLLFSDQIRNKSRPRATRECNEQKVLQEVKYCTVLVLRDDGGHGTGFSIDKGFIVTNRHVIEGAKKLTTWIYKEEPLILWNVSDENDLAVLKLQTEIPTCSWANSQEITLAETLYAVGWPNVPNGESSITRGIFSRTYKTEEGPEFIQTDAAINPGNSGGPLVSKCGIVGINTAKISWSDLYTPSEGFGFALSSNYAKPIIEELIKNGSEKKLPIKKIKLKEYTPQYNYDSNSYIDYRYDSSFINSWVQARNRTREMISYWNSVNSAEYDQTKLNELKDLLARMSAVVETIVPKIEQQKPISNEENSLLSGFNSMEARAVVLESQLDGQNYLVGSYYHYECRNGSCLRVSGRGKNKCSSFYDCQPKYHYVCRDMMCVMVEGGGTDECLISSDCYHYVCQGKSCVKVAGKGTNECYTDYSCKHNECVDGKCVEVEGSGINACYTDYGCKY